MNSAREPRSGASEGPLEAQRCRRPCWRRCSWRPAMPRFWQLSGCCVAPLLLCGGGVRQGDDDDQLEQGHIEKTPGSALVDKVSVHLCRWRRRRRRRRLAPFNEAFSKVVRRLTRTQQVAARRRVCVVVFFTFWETLAAGASWICCSSKSVLS